MELRIKQLGNVAKEADEKASRAKEAKTRKKASDETLEEAWKRIAKMKLSDTDREKLRKVKKAMDEGRIGRRPDSMTTAKGAPKRFSKSEALALYKDLLDAERQAILEDMANNIPENYTLVQSKEALDRILTAMSREDEIVIDVETTGTDVYSDYIVGFVLTLPKQDLHAYIPTKHETDEVQLDHDYVVSRVKPYLEDKRLKKIAHNGKFDVHMCLNEGIRFKNLHFDTQTAFHVLDENIPLSDRALKKLVSKFLKIPSLTYKELFGNKGFHEVSDLRIALAYAAKDGEVTYKLYKYALKHLERVGLAKYYSEVEAPLSEVVVKMERAGFVIDVEKADEIGEYLSGEIARLNVDMREAFGVDDEFNFNSSQQLSKLLFEELRLQKHLPMNMRKKLSTDKKVLAKLAPHHEGIAKLLDYKKKTKLLGTYVDGLKAKIRKDGFLHGEFNGDSTVTGRFSSNSPNLQNQPAYARKMYKAPKGKVLLSGDFSQQEPRILAHFSKEPLLVEAYRNGQDLYSRAASELFDVPIEECGDGSLYRKMLKVGILAVMYGTGAKTLAGQLSSDDRTVSTLEAQKFIDDFYAKYTRVKQWQAELVRYAHHNGFVRMLEGRKRRVPEINSRDEWEVYRAERQVKNSVIQGSAAIQTKRTMLNLDAWCEENEGFSLALQVHDEVGVYVPDTVTPEQVREFERIMLDSVKLDVPNKTDIEAAYTWGDGVAWDTVRGLWVVTDGDKKNPQELGAFETPREALKFKKEVEAT